MRKELHGILYSGVIQEILTTMFHFYVSAQGCLMRICPLLSFLKMTILRRTATIYVFYFNTALATRQAFRRTTSQTYLITSCQIPNSLFFPTACRFVYHQPVSSVRKYLLILNPYVHFCRWNPYVHFCRWWDKQMCLILGTLRLESDSARNNIHLNNKQKPKITNKNTGKLTCQYGQLVWVRKVLQTYVVSFTYIFRCSG